MIALRTMTNFVVLLLLGSSAYAVILVVARGEEPEAQKSWYRQNEVTLVLTGIGNVYPNFFDMIGTLQSLLRSPHTPKTPRMISVISHRTNSRVGVLSELRD